MSNQIIITNRGCNRAIVLCVLYRCLETCQNYFENGLSVQFPFPDDIVERWIVQAYIDSRDETFQKSVGGCTFDTNNNSTHWSTAPQFYTW